MGDVRRWALSAVVFLAAAAAAAIEPPPAAEKWITLQADEFRFVSNVSPRATLGVARDLLRMRAAIGQVTRMNVRSHTRTAVFIFSSRRGFEPYCEAVMGRKTEGISGVYVSGDGGNAILLRTDVRTGIARTVYHELTHYVLRNTAPRAPLWAAEGLAEYFSTFSTTDEQAALGHPIAEHVRFLLNQPLLPMEEVLGMTVDAPLLDDQRRRNAFYAQSWLLVHYLRSGERQRAQLGEFLRLSNGEASPGEAFAAAFATSPEKLADELRHYLRRNTFTVTHHPLREMITPALDEPVPMSRDALLYELGHLLAWQDPPNPAAERFLAEALAVNGAHAGAHAALGRLHRLAGRLAESEASFALAAKHGGDDAELQLQYGLSILQPYADTSTVVPDDVLAKARAAFERSTRLDPAFARAWAELGITYFLADDDPAAGIAALEKSLQLAPADGHAAFHLAALYRDAGRLQDAARLIETVLAHSGTREQLEQARSWLIDGDPRVEAAVRADHTIWEVAEIAKAGRYAEALAILEKILPDIEDPETAKLARQMREDLAARTRKPLR